MAKVKYLHGFDPTEQKRLIHQAEFLEPYVYSGIDLDFKERLLEVGCGVGAQSKILLRRFPKLKIDGLDISKEQLEVARQYLKKEISEKRISLHQQDAQEFTLDKPKYDAAFLCWFLEHVPDPLKVLKRVRKHLKPGAKIYCSEVFNQTLFIEPYSPAYLKYWFEFNDFQWSIGGHPFVGGMLGHYLKEAGFTDIQTEIRSFHFDSREPERRKEFVHYFYQILLSAKDALMNEGRVTPEMLKKMDQEVERVKKAKDSVFFYAWMRATARVPEK
jgi:ubiquinone/menaquinone biosynthesis C-methylase UbiE